MATTLVAFEMHQHHVCIGNVGDSRAYLYRRNLLGQLSIDHTLVNQARYAGVTLSDKMQSSHIITRAIGSSPEVETDNMSIAHQRGDIFLLCSDGLTDMLCDETIAAIVTRFRSNVAQIVQELINAANKYGGKDNITAVAIAIIDR
jgi:protein phosphatase